jgi:hypothetical protein
MPTANLWVLIFSTNPIVYLMKYVFALFLSLGLLLTSADTHAGPGRPSFSSRPSYGGFRSSSSPSYRGFSSSSSRTFSFRSAPTYRAPAAPRYTAPSTSPGRSTYRSSKKTVVHNHYHGSAGASGGSGGLGLMDYVILDNLMSRDRGPAYVSGPTVVHSQPVVAGNALVPNGSDGTVVYQQERHFWLDAFWLILGCGVLYGCYRLLRFALDD